MDDPQRLPGEDSGDSESLRVAREEAWGDAHSLLSAPQHVGPDRPYSTGFRTNHDSISAVRARENEDRMDRVPPLTAPPPDELVVLTPTRVRVDSRVVFVHCTSNWLSNCFLAVLILCKLNLAVNVSWWIVFLPSWLHHSISIPLQGAVVYLHKYLVERHIGPPPPENASPGLALQYSILRKVRTRSHIVDTTNAGIDSLALLIVKFLICYQLSGRMVVADGKTMVDWWSFRLVFVPFWVAWVVTTGLSFFKDQQERVFGSARDLQYVFFLFVACKLDGTSNYSWRIVFLIPWLWFGAIFLLATVVGLLLVLARFWARASELVLPLGFLALLMSCVPQFVSYFSLVCLLDQLEASGTTTVTYETVLLPNAVSWFMMWLASLVLVVGLRQKELVRERLLSAGRVWTAQEYLAMQMSYPTETAQRRVDLMSDEEISSMVEEMMRGKTKPAMMVRVGETLYRILTGAENEGTQVVPMESGGDVEMGTLLKGKTLQDQYNNPANSTIENPSHCCSKGSDPTLLAAESVASLLPSLPGQPKDELSESNAMAVHPEPNDIADAASACSDDHQCIICCDAPQTCIFLTCGHGGYCRRCANLVFVRPPNSCPTCRQPIEQIVELECASRRVGDVLRVK